MPSGAKKRKAAKKKKEKEAHINTDNNTNTNNSNKPLGNNDPRSQDEKDSDGEGGSPTSGGNNSNQHSFDEGNGESAVADKSMKEGTGDAQDTCKVALDDRHALKIQRDLNGKKSVILDVIKDDSSSSSTSSSSDDDSQVIQVKTDKEAHNVDKPVGLGLGEVVQVNANDSLKAAKEVIDSVRAFASEVEETIHVTEGIAAETSVASDVGKTSFNKKKGLPPKLEELSEVLSAMEDLQSRGNADNVFPICDENVGASSGVLESAVKGSDSKIWRSSDAPVTESLKTMESPKDSKIPEYSEEKPHVCAAPPPMGQRTSWLSCCGLFDVLTGSGR